MTDLPPLYAYATRLHYGRHLEPIADAVRARGVEVVKLKAGRTPPNDAHVLVASGTDMAALTRRKLIYVEHGAGQSYDGDPEAKGKRGYPGGDDADDVGLFLTPSEAVAAKWQERYPKARSVAVGCPALDSWHTDPPKPDTPRLVLTFHWPSRFCLEAGTAWPLYQRYIAEQIIPLALREGWSVVGTEHPRWQKELLRSWQTMGVTTIGYNKAMETGTLLIADNTSMLPEFASTGRPVLFLDSPEWRRDVDHGGRFWKWPEGQVSCDSPFNLREAVLEAITDRTSVREARQRMVSDVYVATDGKAAERAADAVCEYLASGA